MKHRTGPSVASAVGRFAIAGIAVMVAVGLTSAWASRSTATDEAVRDARGTTRILARGIVEPALTDDLVDGDPDAVEALDRVVRTRVLDDSVTRVKLWTSDGRIVYSDEPRLIGAQYELEEHDLETIRGGGVAAEVSDLSHPENRFERELGKLLEVYVGVETPDGEPLLLEAYFRYDVVASSARRIWSSFFPLALAALVLLAFLQLPLAWSLARRIRDGERQRQRLLGRVIEASDTERRRIAGDLHDGVVQDLAGLSYALAASADGADARGERELAGTMRGAAETTRRSIRSLRSLLVDIYPPSLQRAGLQQALADLAAPLAGRGIETHLDVSAVDGLAPETEALVFRTAQEALRNAVRHGRPERITIRLAPGSDGVVLDVEDNGLGFSTEATAGEAHMGLRVLADLASDAGANLDVTSQPGAGTRVRLEAPA